MLVNNINRLKIERRYRLEQRRLLSSYRNRFRYRFYPIVPINKSTVEKGSLFASIYAEIFLTNKGQYFERVRFFGGLGYRFSNPFTLPVGWITGFDYWAIIPALKKIFYKHLYSFGKTNKNPESSLANFSNDRH